MVVVVVVVVVEPPSAALSLSTRLPLLTAFRCLPCAPHTPFPHIPNRCTLQRYATRIFSRSWLDSKGLLDHIKPEHQQSLNK